METVTNVLNMPARTYRAQLFRVRCEAGEFQVAGTLDGGIDLALPESGTFQLGMNTALALAEALTKAIRDVQNNCLYDRDSLLEKRN